MNAKSLAQGPAAQGEAGVPAAPRDGPLEARSRRPVRAVVAASTFAGCCPDALTGGWRSRGDMAHAPGRAGSGPNGLSRCSANAGIAAIAIDIAIRARFILQLRPFHRKLRLD